jgi:hypothetical protein
MLISMKPEVAILLGCVASGCGGSASRDFDAADRFERELAATCDLESRGLTDGRRAELRAGTTIYQEEQAARCLAFLDRNSCVHASPKEAIGLGYFVLRLPGICRSVYAGTLALGEPCSESAQCEGDAYCAITGEVGPGTCTARTAPGTPCTSDGSCSVTEEQIPECVLAADGTRQCSAT